MRRTVHVTIRGFAAALAVVVLDPTGILGQEEAGPGVVPPSAAYIGETAEVGGHDLARWRLDPEGVRTLWVHFSTPPADRAEFWTEIKRAVSAWNGVPDLPLSFRYTEHAQGADVRFRWIQRFKANQAGTTDWQTDGEGWLASAVVTLAVEHVDGTPMSDEFLLLVALHELGHVVGLPHSENPMDVMHPGNRSRSLSDRDVRSARQLYTDVAVDSVGAP